MEQKSPFQHDREILRPLTNRLREFAADPINNEKIDQWKRHTSLRGEKPMVFVFPDGAWNELLPLDSLQCIDPVARDVEYELRKRLLRQAYIRDDVPITAEIEVKKAVHNTMWGVEPLRRPAQGRGAYHMVPIIEEPTDWKKLSAPVVTHDEAESQRRLTYIAEAIGDLVPVTLVGVKDFDFHLLHWYCDYRGLDNMLFDLYDEPETFHEVMRFFTDGVKSMLRQYEELNLISLNNDRTFHYTGGVGYTDDLPAPGFRPDRVRLCDVWGAAEAQEFAQVSPEMHEEFVLQYERELLEPFGLNGYGCCDDLSAKLDNVLKIKNLRRVAVCPWADIAQFTPVLKKNYIMTWKPKPMHLAADELDCAAVSDELCTGLTKARGGIIEMILRDTHTCRNDPTRFGRWVELAREAIEAVWE